MSRHVSLTSPNFPRTKNIPKPNQYVQMLSNEFFNWALDEDRAPKNKNSWRKLFGADESSALDLEIGPGNGYHFAHHVLNNPDRSVIAIELKFKPLIQSIRRAVRAGAKNARIIRYDADKLEELFSPNELNNVFIHFPDPWELGPQWKHRLITDEYLEKLFHLQRPGSFLEFKTDSASYFKWTLPRIIRSKYQIEFVTNDLHSSLMKEKNFITSFERIFMNKGQPIHYILCYKY